MLKIEKGSEKYFGITVLLLSILLILSSLGKVTWIQWVSVLFSIVLGLVIYSESGIRGYLARKGYKSVDSNDLIVWFGFIFGTFLILNGLLLISMIRNVSPEWLINFVSWFGVIGGVGAGLLGVFLLFTPRPKA